MEKDGTNTIRKMKKGHFPGWAGPPVGIAVGVFIALKVLQDPGQNPAHRWIVVVVAVGIGFFVGCSIWFDEWLDAYCIRSKKRCEENIATFQSKPCRSRPGLIALAYITILIPLIGTLMAILAVFGTHGHSKSAWYALLLSVIVPLSIAVMVVGDKMKLW